MTATGEVVGTRYRLRQSEVEAVRLSDATFGRLIRAIPLEWFYGAHNGDGSEPMQILIRIYPGASDCVKAVEGDWVTRDAHREWWSAYSPEEFAERYAVVLLDADGVEVES